MKPHKMISFSARKQARPKKVKRPIKIIKLLKMKIKNYPKRLTSIKAKMKVMMIYLSLATSM